MAHVDISNNETLKLLYVTDIKLLIQSTHM